MSQNDNSKSTDCKNGQVHLHFIFTENKQCVKTMKYICTNTHCKEDAKYYPWKTI